jgi:hypothetical protein
MVFVASEVIATPIRKLFLTDLGGCHFVAASMKERILWEVPMKMSGPDFCKQHGLRLRQLQVVSTSARMPRQPLAVISDLPTNFRVPCEIY